MSLAMIQASKPLTVVGSKIRLTGLIGKTNARGTTGLMYSWGSLRHITTSGSAKATVQLATSAVDPGGMASGRAQASPHFGVDLHALPFNTGSPRGEPYWQKIPQWKDVSEQDFLSFQWQTDNVVEGRLQLLEQFLEKLLPEQIPPPRSDPGFSTMRQQPLTRDNFIKDIKEGMNVAPMAIRLTPHILSCIDWSHPVDDPLFRQFIPVKSALLPDHPELALDSLNETMDSPVNGLVHRYPDKVLFLATSICPSYCRYCTRSYSVGLQTWSVKKKPMTPSPRRWERMFEYIERTPTVTDVVVSGGDAYMLDPKDLETLGKRLLSIPHVRRIRFGSRGVAFCPSRIIDPQDTWAHTLIRLSNDARNAGKSVALHTHINHPNEINWVTRLAAQRLYRNGVVVRNQAVLLKRVNNELPVLNRLIRELADMNIQPYYVYQLDMVKGVEDLRTPLHEIIDLQKHVQGSIGGMVTPQFVVDLPGGGGKRLVTQFETYDRTTGISKFLSPNVKGGKDAQGKERVYEYHDPLWSLNPQGSS